MEEDTFRAPVLAEVISGNSVVGWRFSVYLLCVYFLTVDACVDVVPLSEAASEASISAIYLSKSSVLDFVGTRCPLTLRYVPMGLDPIRELIGDGLWGKCLCLGTGDRPGTGLKTMGVADPVADSRRGGVGGMVVSGGGEMGGDKRGEPKCE